MKLRRKRNSVCSRSAALLLALLLALSSLSVLFTGCSEAETQAAVEEAADIFVEGLLDALETAPHDDVLPELTETAPPVDTEIPPSAEEAPSAEADPSVERVDRTMYLADTVRARKTADKNADYDGKIERGTAVRVLTHDTETNWCSFEYDGRVYYVNRQSLTDKQPDVSPKPEETLPVTPEAPSEPEQPDEHTYYYSKDDVALYLHVYGHLPDNYITKNEAQKRGWDSSKGNLWDVADGFCIGGDRFGNYEGLLPKNNGTYYECDVGYAGGFRGADRLIFDTKGDIWYTGDHYASFDKLY